MQAPAAREDSIRTAPFERGAVATPPEGSVAFRVAKRTVDVLVAAAVLVVTAPVSLAIALLVKLEDGGPVLFRQRRVGRSGVPFTLHKFRSMHIDAEAETGPTWARADDPRVTRIGRRIRALGMDEIPQLWNVLRGDMSLVGPRPERPEFLDRLRRELPGYDQRHAVRPGITGWAQLHLPHVETIADAGRKLDFDLYYLRHLSVGLDFLILARTAAMLLFGRRRR